jgi:3-methyladenine DNA glycosylase AlkC
MVTTKPSWERRWRALMGVVPKYRTPDMKKGAAGPKRGQDGTPGVPDMKRAAKAVAREIAAGDLPGREVLAFMAAHANAGVRFTGALVAGLAPLTPRDWPARAKLAAALADDDNWEVREAVIGAVRALVEADYDRGVALLLKWAHGGNVNLKRAAALAVMAKKTRRWPGDLEDCFAVLEPLMSCRAEYVRKNLGPFALGSSLGVVHPAKTVAFLWRMAGAAEEQVRWNVAMAFSQSFGAQRPELALPLLTRLAADESKYVRTAAAASLRNIGRRHPRLIEVVLRQWEGDESRREVAERVRGFLK